MLTENDAVRVFDTIMSSPGMNEMVRMDLKISRKNVLLLHHVIERGITENEGSLSLLLQSIPKENTADLRQLSEECLQRAGLTELNGKLSDLGTEKKKSS
ncbi:hypothetical protein [Flavobacterium chungbukense]|uniref:Uncharacterized protein n=1 Tax=Flavobacterium chungbukense TaxID=877464 RepID=A0ABP7YEF6_9FLAO|nr:hypothetical protein [Flavobacterium chungbukense]MCC4920556.1 hypothetical protein [Flavobacterium chungbukense]